MSEPSRSADDRGVPDPDELVTIATFWVPFEAEMARSRLDAEGVQALLANEVLVRLAGPLVGNTAIHLQVRREDAEKAAEILGIAAE